MIISSLKSGSGLTAVAFCLLVVGSASLLGVELPGLVVRENTQHMLAISYKPVIASWDTTEIEGIRYVRPDIKGAQLRVSKDGTLTQWVVSADVLVPGSEQFSIESKTIRTIELHSSLVFAVPTIEGFGPVLTQEPISERLQLRYDGIAGDRHVAQLTLVIASQENGVTVVTNNVELSIAFKGQPGPTQRGSLKLDVLNPDAPWVISRTRNVSKQNQDLVQVSEPFTRMFRIPTDREGLYRVTADQLKSIGIPTDNAGVASVRVFGRGGAELPEIVDSAYSNELLEQPIIVRTNGDGSLRDVIFYAAASSGWQINKSGIQHFINNFSNTTSYYLTSGSAKGLRSTVRQASANSADTRPSVVTGRVFVEDEINSPYSSGSGRRWFGRSIDNGGAITVSQVLPGLVRQGTLLYRYVVAHRGSTPGTASLTESGTSVSQLQIRAVPKYMDAYSAVGEATLNASVVPSDGRSSVRISYTSTDRISSGLLDWIEIHYPRLVNAQDNEFEFWTVKSPTGTHEYGINGFSGEIFGFDVSNRSRPVQVENVSTTGGMFVLREDVDSTSTRRYYISSTLRSTSLHSIAYPNLRATPRGSELIVITHPSLLESAEGYAAYRRLSSGIGVSVVTTEEIYNEFSYGSLDPTAIRDFLAMAWSTYSPRPHSVLLWGDGHFDYKNISTTLPSYVTSYQSLDPDDQDYGLYTYTTDDFFVRLAGNDKRPEMAIGRLPISSNSIGNRLLKKIKRYEEQAATDEWRTRITVVADDGQQGEGLSDRSTHLDQSEALIRNHVLREFQPRKIYLVEYPTENVARGRRKPTVTQDMLSTINTNGTLLLNWIGHGNPRVWAHESIFVRETTPAEMTNVDKPFFLTAATCDFARWDMTELQSGAEDLLLLENGGAIGVFSAARVVFSTANAEINQEFYTQLFTRDFNGNFPTVGEVMYKVKQKYFGNNDEKFHLLADPTLRLHIPNQRVRFSAVNSENITADGPNVSITALSTVEVEGFVSGGADSTPDAGFNGYVTVSLVDANQVVTAVDTDIYSTINTFVRPGPALSRGSFVVTNGRFTASFVVPKDISFSSQNASLYGYAASGDNRFAMGVTSKVVVDGVTTVIDPETDGPEINIYLDSRKFLAGGLVRQNPILIVDLEDKTGINTTGIGIGHDIEAEFNNGTLKESLTRSFSTSLTNSRAGTAQKQIFGLADGLHTVRVRAWDVLNNVSETQTSFRIASSPDGILVGGLYNFPNPFTSTTTIRFVHNSARPFQADLMILDVQGRLIIDRSMRIMDMQTADLLWDGKDSAGSPMGAGIYQAVVRLTDESGATSYVGGKLALIR